MKIAWLQLTLALRLVLSHYTGINLTKTSPFLVNELVHYRDNLTLPGHFHLNITALIYKQIEGLLKQSFKKHSSERQRTGFHSPYWPSEHVSAPHLLYLYSSPENHHTDTPPDRYRETLEVIIGKKIHERVSEQFVFFPSQLYNYKLKMFDLLMSLD